MIHTMKLLEKPFEEIKNGSKTIEFRIYDEKRQKVKIGDKIEFSKLPELKEKLVVKVLDIYNEKTFKDLFEKLYRNEEEIESKIKSIYSIYSISQEEKYGVIGIKIKLDTDILRKQIEEYIPYNEQEEKDKNIVLKYIDMFDNSLTRENEFGHFTASGWVLNKERTKVLMIYHNIYKSWGWTGGHADGEENLMGVALREVNEETGIENIVPIKNDIFSLEVLCVKGHVRRGKYVSSHVHLNLTYLFKADEHEKTRIKEDENSGVRWVDIDKAIELSTETEMKKIYEKLIEKMRNY